MLSPSPPHLEYISLITNVIALPSPPRVYQFNNKCYRPPLPTSFVIKLIYSRWGGEGEIQIILISYFNVFFFLIDFG